MHFQYDECYKLCLGGDTVCVAKENETELLEIAGLKSSSVLGGTLPSEAYS